MVKRLKVTIFNHFYIYLHTYSIGIPTNQQSLYTPGIVYGAAPISISSTYAEGFDQHQKLLQLQGSATQAGHGKKLTYFLAKN